MDGPWGYYAKWSKSDGKGQKAYYSLLRGIQKQTYKQAKQKHTLIWTTNWLVTREEEWVKGVECMVTNGNETAGVEHGTVYTDMEL